MNIITVNEYLFFEKRFDPTSAYIIKNVNEEYFDPSFIEDVRDVKQELLGKVRTNYEHYELNLVKTREID